MNWGSWGIGSFLATLVLTSIMATSQSLGLTRISLPYMLGTIFTPDRERAKVIGFVFHLVNGWLFALVYVALFNLWGHSGWLRGMLLGGLHAGIVLTTVMPLLPAFHPRMATETQGPTALRMLEPPGMLALHYGPRTPLSVLLAHLLYGAILGTIYHPPG